MLYVFDFGNARIKGFCPKTNTLWDALHAIVELTENEWQVVTGGGKPPEGVIKVNGKPYAVGDYARRHVLSERPMGASRYKPEYYGVGLCYAMAESIGKSNQITLFASHAPQDKRFSQDIVNVAQREWAIEYRGGTIVMDVTKVATFDEPIGGYAHYAFTEKGEPRRKNMAADKTSLVIDVGGYTADRASVDSGGHIDPLSIKSVRAGTIEVLNRFENDLRDKYKDEFQDAGTLDIKRVEAAIVEGYYAYGKHKLPCEELARGAINRLVNDVRQIINTAGGAANYDLILMTGGGSALIYDALVEAYPKIEFVLCEPQRQQMKFANVLGGAKIAALMRRVKV